MNSELPFSICLDTPYGDKRLYVNDARICEFRSYAAASWQEARFATRGEAESLIAKHYAHETAVYITESL